MQADIAALAGLIWRSIVAPAKVGAALAAVRLSRGVLWQALLLVTVVSGLTLQLIGGPLASPIGSGQVLGPYANTMILGASLVMLVFALFFTGRALGGTGRFPAALALVAWLEVVAIVLRIAVFLASQILGPAISAGLPLLVVAVLFWTMINFVRALHGFATLGRAIMTLVLAVLGIGFGLTLILAAIDILSGGALRHV